MHFSDFYKFYIENVRKISSTTMITNIQEIDEDLLDAGICWMVTDNLVTLLAEDVNHANIISLTELSSFLVDDNLIVIAQDMNSDDHWFALIPDGDVVHLMEHLPFSLNHYAKLRTLSV